MSSSSEATIPNKLNVGTQKKRKKSSTPVDGPSRKISLDSSITPLKTKPGKKTNKQAGGGVDSNVKPLKNKQAREYDEPTKKKKKKKGQLGDTQGAEPPTTALAPTVMRKMSASTMASSRSERSGGGSLMSSMKKSNAGSALSPKPTVSFSNIGDKSEAQSSMKKKSSAQKTQQTMTSTKREYKRWAEERDKSARMVDNIKIVSPNYRHPPDLYALAALLSLNCFIIGYTHGIFKTTKRLVVDLWDLNEAWKKSLDYSFDTSRLFGIFLSIYMCDVIGRRSTIFFASVMLIVGGAVSGTANEQQQVLAGFILFGISNGLIAVSAMVYMVEISAPSVRGTLTATYVFSISVGYLVSSVARGLFNEYKVEGDLQWRWLMGGTCFAAVIQLTFLNALPGSPRYHIMDMNQVEAINSLKRLRQVKFIVLREKCEIEVMVNRNRPVIGIAAIKQIFETTHTRRAVVVALILTVFKYSSGTFAIYEATEKILQTAGFEADESHWLRAIDKSIISLTLLVTCWAVEFLGRRYMIIFGYLLVALSLVILGPAFYLLQFNAPIATPTETFKNDSCKVYNNCWACVDWHTDEKGIKDKLCGFCFTRDKVQDLPTAVGGECVTKNFKESNFAEAGYCSQYGQENPPSSGLEYRFHHDMCPSKFPFTPVLGLVLYLVSWNGGVDLATRVFIAEIGPSWARSQFVAIILFTEILVERINEVWIYTYMKKKNSLNYVFAYYSIVALLGVIFAVVFVPETRGIALEFTDLLFMPRKWRRILAAERNDDVQRRLGII